MLHPLSSQHGGSAVQRKPPLQFQDLGFHLTNNTSIVSPAQTRRAQGAFFDLVFGNTEGFVFISHGVPNGDGNEDWHDEPFLWPKNKKGMLEYIERITDAHNVYFCSQLFSKPTRRVKDNISVCPNIWADLEGCNPDIVEPEAPLILESSPGRYQAFWPLSDGPLPGAVAEDYCKRLHYKYADNGADISGWDLTQVLRVPYTYNYKAKYGNPAPVKLLKAQTAKVPAVLFDDLPQIPGKSFDRRDMPPPDEFRDYDTIIKEYGLRLTDEYYVLHDTIPEPGADWSKKLWRMLLVAFNCGLPTNDVYVCARTSQVDKFARNQLPPTHLWYDVLRAEQTSKIPALYGNREQFEFPELVDELEVEPHGFVFDYIEWASQQSDAARVYHEVAAFIMLSAVLSGSLRMPLANIGELIPNLWALIVADTTITRKTTAMKTAMDIVQDVDPDVVLATDGSIEGMLQSLSQRPNRASVFLRDEFSGFMEAATKKDYMAGTLEALTKLYDGEMQRRVLSKSTVEVRDPVVLVFGGGIKNKLMSILNERHVTSGFLPRFIVVSAESDLTKMKPLARREVVDQIKRDEFVKYLGHLRDTYHSERPVTIAGVTKIQMQHIHADITDEALAFYNEIELQLVTAGFHMAEHDIYMPILDRMSKTLLKMAMLVAATRQEPNDEFKITVELQDIKMGALYTQRWAPHMMELLQNIGLNAAEQAITKVEELVRKHPGIARSDIMRRGRLQAWEMENIVKTLEQRMIIRGVKDGKLTRYWMMDD